MIQLRVREKPSYLVPSMSEIAVLPWNGFHVASLFSGCGGSSLGYKMARFHVVWANEFIPAAQEVYRLNHPGTILDTRDIRQIQPQDILTATGLAHGQLDLLDGSPPCASFSTAGKREKGWGKVKAYSDTKQRVDDLFWEYARLLNGLQPRVFVAENVSGLIKGVAKGYFLDILKMLKDCGYRVECRLLDAQWLGVPQMRQRTIFLGVRNDLDLVPVFPKPLPYRYSVRETLGVAFRTKSYASNSWTSAHHPAAAIQASGQYFVEEANGLNAKGLGIHRLLGFTIAELKRICAFPDDFQLTGTYAQQWERLGRAVPPVMMWHIASTIQEQILDRIA